MVFYIAQTAVTIDEQTVKLCVERDVAIERDNCRCSSRSTIGMVVRPIGRMATGSTRTAEKMVRLQRPIYEKREFVWLHLDGQFLPTEESFFHGPEGRSVEQVEHMWRPTPLSF